MVCNCLKRLNSGFRRNDGKQYFWTFYEAIKLDGLVKSQVVTPGRNGTFVTLLPVFHHFLSALQSQESDKAHHQSVPLPGQRSFQRP